MATAARVHIAESGTDPLRYRMVAFGGAGPVHAYEIARLLNVREVIFPRGAGVASAIGMLVAPRSVEYTRSLIAPLDRARLAGGRRDDRRHSRRAAGPSCARPASRDDDIAVELSADMRYVGQGFEVTVPLDRDLPGAARCRGAGGAPSTRNTRDRFGRNLGTLAGRGGVLARARAARPPR